jgi:hypothetical protein
MNWQQITAQVPPSWTGNLDDDRSVQGAGLTLRAEGMQGDLWFWCVYDDATGDQVVTSDSLAYGGRCDSGEAARSAAEKAARIWLGLA